MKDKQLPHPGETILDLARGTLHRGGRLVMLRPKTFEILAFLAGKAGQVVGKEELLQGVWPGLAVTEDSITQGIRDVRRSLAEEGPAIIRTVPRRGYLFELPETGFRLVSAEPQAIAETGQAMAEPKVAVLAFHLSAGVQDRRGLFDEVASRIAAALCCFRTVSVLEAPAAAALAQTPPEAMQSALAQAGADYLVEGRVERGGDRYGVVIALSDTRSGRRLWTQPFSFPPGEIRVFRDGVAMQVGSVLAFNIENHMAQRLPLAAARSVEAHILTMRGMMLVRSFGEDSYERAHEFLVRAVALDPRSGLALAYLSLVEAVLKGSYGTRPSERLDRALEMALQAVTLSPSQARCHRVLAVILLLRRDFARAEAHYRQALDLNPYDADTIAQMGWLKAIRGDPAAGLELVEWAMRLNPVHPPWYYLDRGVVQLLLGRHGEAAETFARMPPRDVNRWALLSVCQALQGDREAAAASIRQARKLEPGLTAAMIQHVIMLEGEAGNAWLRAALAKAGWV